MAEEFSDKMTFSERGESECDSDKNVVRQLFGRHVLNREREAGDASKIDAEEAIAIRKVDGASLGALISVSNKAC